MPEAFPHEARCGVCRHQGSLDADRPGSTHRIRQEGEITPSPPLFHGLMPPDPMENCGGGVFSQRCLGGAPTISPLVEAFPGEVEIEGPFSRRQVEKNPDVRSLCAHVRADSPGIPKAVDYGILYRETGEAWIPEGYVAYAVVDEEAFIRGKMVLPVNLPCQRIEFFCVSRISRDEPEIDATCQMGPEAEAIGKG